MRKFLSGLLLAVSMSSLAFIGGGVPTHNHSGGGSGGGTLSPTTLNIPAGTSGANLTNLPGGCVNGTQVTASGVLVDFTGIPSTARVIYVQFNGLSASGTTADYYIQIGTAGGVEITGYQSVGTVLPAGLAITGTSYTVAYGIRTGAAADTLFGHVVLSRMDSSTNTWTASGFFYGSNQTTTKTTAGSKSLSGVLDRVRIATSNGTDTWDAGTLNILYCS